MAQVNLKLSMYHCFGRQMSLFVKVCVWTFSLWTCVRVLMTRSPMYTLTKASPRLLKKQECVAYELYLSLTRQVPLEIDYYVDEYWCVELALPVWIFLMHHCVHMTLYEVIDRASNIPWLADFYAALRNSPFAVEKCGIARFLLHLYLIQGFSGSFLILPFIKQQNVSRSKLTFMIITTNLW